MDKTAIAFPLIISFMSLMVYLFVLTRNERPKTEFRMAILSFISIFLGLTSGFLAWLGVPAMEETIVITGFIALLCFFINTGLLGYFKDERTGKITIAIVFVIAFLLAFMILTLTFKAIAS